MLFSSLARTPRYDPFEHLNRLHREMTRLFDHWDVSNFEEGHPAVNVITDRDSVTVLAEIPGVHPEDLDISVLGNTLTLKGQRRPLELGEGEKLLRQERNYGEFVRIVRLPIRVDANRVEAHYEHGVLRVVLPRSEEDRPRQVRVVAGK